jgi:hypothetical protein
MLAVVKQGKVPTMVSGEECSLFNAWRECANCFAGSDRREFIKHFIAVVGAPGSAIAGRDRAANGRRYNALEQFQYRRMVLEQLTANELELLELFRLCSRRWRSAIVNYAEQQVGWEDIDPAKSIGRRA